MPSSQRWTVAPAIDAAGLRVERVQVGEEALDDRLVALAHQRGGGLRAGEQHQAAAGLSLTGAQRVRLVGEHVEHPAGRGHRVHAVVGHRGRLVRLDRDAEEGAVSELRERARGPLGDGRYERRRERGLAATITSRARISSPPHTTTRSAPSGRIASTRASVGRVAELATQRRGQLAGAAEQVAGDQRALAAPHEREQADAAAGRELVELGGRAVRGAGEDLVHGGRQRAEELAEGAVVLEGVAVLGR